MTSKMTQEFRLIGDPISGNGRTVLPYFFNDFDQEIEMTLGINASGKCQAHQLQRCWRFVPCFIDPPKHQRAQFNTSDVAFDIQRIYQTNAGILVRCNMSEKLFGIKKNSMATHRFDKGNASGLQFIPEILHRCVSVNLIINFQGLF